MDKSIFYFSLIITFLLFSSDKLMAQDDGLDEYVNGEILRRGKSYHLAIIQFSNAIKKAPSNYRYIHARGLCYTSLKNYKNAIKDFNLSVHLNEEYVPSYLALSAVYNLKDDSKNTIENLDNAFIYESDTLKRTSYKLKIIEMLYSQHEIENVFIHVKSAKIANPNSLPILYYDASISNKNGDFSIAIENMNRAIMIVSQNNPTSTFLSKYYYQLAYAYHYSENFSLANKAIENISDPSYKKLARLLMPEYTYLLAFAYYKIHEFEIAEIFLDKCLNIDNKYVRAHDLHYHIDDEKRDHSDLLIHLKKSISYESNDVILQHKYEILCKLLITNQKYEECIKYADFCLINFDKNKTVLFLKTIALKRSGNLNEAAKTMVKLIKLKEPDLDIMAKYQFKMARIYEKTGEYEKAVESYKKALYGSYFNAAILRLNKLNPEINARKQN